MSWWGFFSAAGAVTAVLWLLGQRRNLGLSGNEFWAAVWVLLAGAIAGAKTLFVILGWQHYARGDLKFWADFAVGFVFFGGLFGGVFAGFVFARLRRLDFARSADYFAVAIPMGQSIGRIGCFLTGCCPGIAPHPVQLYESFGLALIALACRGILARVQSGTSQTGAAFRCYLILYGLFRILLDPLRADGHPGRLFGMSYQQWAALLIVIAAFVRHKRPHSLHSGSETQAS